MTRFAIYIRERSRANILDTVKVARANDEQRKRGWKSEDGSLMETKDSHLKWQKVKC